MGPESATLFSEKSIYRSYIIYKDITFIFCQGTALIYCVLKLHTKWKLFTENITAQKGHIRQSAQIRPNPTVSGNNSQSWGFINLYWKIQVSENLEDYG